MTNNARRIAWAALVMLAGVLAWFIVPLYGFVSHQYGIARTPWGWEGIPPVAKAGCAAADHTIEVWRRRINAPSLSAAVYIGPELAWAGAAGWADVASRVQATPQTAYRIGSSSKAVTATLLARLTDNGLVDPSARIDHYLAELPHPKWGPITLHQLASHTAGLPGYEENTDLVGLYQSMALRTSFTSPTDALSVFDDSELLFDPGEDYHYSSYDTVLLSAVLEQAARKPFLELVAREITQPLGTGELGADGMAPHPGHVATFYDRMGDKVRPWRSVDLSHKLAGGGFIATPTQLARIGSAWLDEGFITPDVRQLFWTPVAVADGTVNEEDYAMGWRRKIWNIPRLGLVENVNHGGVSKGSQCWLMVVPKQRISLAACMNALTDDFFDFADVSRELLPLFVDRP